MRFKIIAVLLLLAIAGLGCSGLFSDLYGFLLLSAQGAQRDFHDAIAANLRLLANGDSWGATSGLALVGFLYGALHAVGPGHGKLVVSSYLLAGKSDLKRGLVVTFAAALLQAVVAIALIFGLIFLFGLTNAAAQQTTVRLEAFSIGLVGLVGLFFFLRGAREMKRLLFPTALHHHGHHPHEHGEGCCCHGPMPDARQVAQADKPLALFFMIISIGLRPCSGALLLLLFAGMIGAYTPGIIATFAMALGTALSTSLIAILAVQSKKWALRFSEASESKLRFVHAGLGMAGGMAILLLGFFLLMATPGLDGLFSQTPQPPSHPLLRTLPQGG